MSKSAKEWLEHFPPDVRERVLDKRKRRFFSSDGDLMSTYKTLLSMYFQSIGYDDRYVNWYNLDPYWNDVCLRIEAGEFDQPWEERIVDDVPVTFEIGDIVELRTDKGTLRGCIRLYTAAEGVYLVEWENGNGDRTIIDDNLKPLLHKVGKRLTVYEKYPIGSKWTVDLEVVRHFNEDGNFPIGFRILSEDENDDDDSWWFAAGELSKFKPIKD